jgi:hypothetical protein
MFQLFGIFQLFGSFACIFHLWDLSPLESFTFWDLSPFGIFHLPGAATDTTKQVPFIMSAECVFKRSGRAPTVDPLTGEVRQGDTIAGKLPNKHRTFLFE